MDLKEIKKLIKAGKSREEIEAIFKERHPQPLLEAEHRGVRMTVKADGSTTASAWVTGENDDRIERSMDYLTLTAVLDHKAAIFSKKQGDKSRKYSDEDNRKMLEIVRAYQVSAPKNYKKQARSAISKALGFDWATQISFDQFVKRLIAWEKGQKKS